MIEFTKSSKFIEGFTYDYISKVVNSSHFTLSTEEIWKKIGINLNSTKDKEGKIIKYVELIVRKYFIGCKIYKFYDAFHLEKEENRELDLLIALGGDGTILRAARSVEKVVKHLYWQ